MKNNASLLTYGFLSVALGTAQILVQAQTPSTNTNQALLAQTPTLQAIPDGLDVVPVIIHNVSAAQIAWTLDPASNNTGVFRKVPRDASFNLFSVPKQVELPAGMNRVVPAKASNAVLLVGTAEGIDKTKAIIEVLDKRVRQIEIESQFASLDDEAMAHFGLKASQETQRSVVKQNYYSLQKSLLDAGKLKIYATPRILSNTGSPAAIGFSTKTNSVVGYKDESGAQHSIPDANLTASVFKGFQVTCTVGPKSTINIKAVPTSVLEFAAGENKMPVITADKNATDIIIRDGDTIAISSIDKRFFPDVSEKEAKKLKNMVLFVTARIVYRGDEVGPEYDEE